MTVSETQNGFNHFNPERLSAAVKNQYERYPFPPLALDALADIRPPQADARFAFIYLDQAPPQQVRILDAGCGTGFSTLKLAQANPKAEIVALELSEASLEIARERLGAQSTHLASVRFLQADLQSDLLQRYPDLGHFDYIHCSGVIHHIPDPLLALQELRRLLAPAGIFYLMVYAGSARHEIETIQRLLQILWQDTSNWEQGLMICRQLLQNLPEGHQLKQHYLNSLQTVTDVLGVEAAYSDAFLVDTYLQRCEWRWNQAQWFQVLNNAGLVPCRWLDHASWQADPYLPTLPDFRAPLSQEQSLMLIDQVRPPQNYAIYLQSDRLTNGSVLNPSQKRQKYDPTASPRRFDFIQAPNTEQLLGNARGQALVLRPWMQSLWQGISGQQNWDQLWQEFHQVHPNIDHSSFVEFAQQLLNLYYLWQQPRLDQTNQTNQTNQANERTP